jgi:hypothetical protein
MAIQQNYKLQGGVVLPSSYWVLQLVQTDLVEATAKLFFYGWVDAAKRTSFKTAKNIADTKRAEKEVKQEEINTAETPELREDAVLQEAIKAVEEKVALEEMVANTNIDSVRRVVVDISSVIDTNKNISIKQLYTLAMALPEFTESLEV